MTELTAAQIISDTCRKHMVPLKELSAGSRRKDIVLARHEIFHRIRMEKKWSYYRIAKLFGYHHSTVLDGIIKHQQRKDMKNEKINSVDTRRERRLKAYA